MAIKLLVVGKTKEKFYLQSEEEYLKRLRPLTKLEYVTLKASKNETDRIKCLEQEEEGILKEIKETDQVILLDEKGKEFNSREFAQYLNDSLNHSANLIFVIGGAFGFSDKVRARANENIALSKLTFPHHLVRTIFLEQLYRAYTILRGGYYHND